MSTKPTYHSKAHPPLKMKNLKTKPKTANPKRRKRNDIRHNRRFNPKLGYN